MTMASSASIQNTFRIMPGNLPASAGKATGGTPVTDPGPTGKATGGTPVTDPGRTGTDPRSDRRRHRHPLV